MTEERYPINYNDEYHSLRIIPEGMPIYNTDDQGVKHLNGRSTWFHWQLIPTSRPVINPAPFKANFISIPGGNGSIDASTVLTNYPTYEDRSGSIEFKSIRDYGSPTGWVRTYELIQNYLHGRRFRVILYDDPLFYYQGRMTVNSWKSDKDWSTITLDYRFDPFKYWVGSDDHNTKYYSNLPVIGKGFNTNNYDSYVTKSFNHANLAEYKLEQYGLPNDVGWTMPVSPEIIIRALPYANFASYIPHKIIKDGQEVTVGTPIYKDVYDWTIIGVEYSPELNIKYTLSGSGAWAGGDARLWAFLDENYNMITVAPANNAPTTISAPERARWLVVNMHSDSSNKITSDAGPVTYTWHSEHYIPTGLIVKPSQQNPSYIRFVQGTVKDNIFTKKAEATYEFTDENTHSVNAYGILFNNDITTIRIYAEAYQKFIVSYNFKRGLL